LRGKYPGDVASNLAVLGGNDPHSYGVTSRRASMNTLRPNVVSFADALFAKPQRNWWPHYRLLTELLKVDVYLMAYVSKTNNIKIHYMKTH